MIYTITFNPALDYTMFIDKLSTDDINRATHTELCFGGKGINVSVMLARLGIKSTALGFLAGFTGKRLEEMLTDEGIDCDFVYLENGETRINVKLRSDSELDINAQGPEIDKKAVDSLFERLKKLGSNDCLVLAGSTTKGITTEVYEKILRLASEKGCKIAVDTTGELLLKAIEYKPFLIKPNHLELGELFKVKISSPDDACKYAKVLRDKGAQNVLVSCADMGAVLIDETDSVHKIGAARGDFVSSVGCGDSMIAGFLAAVEGGNNYTYALKLGSACGSATAFTTELADKESIDKILKLY